MTDSLRDRIAECDNCGHPWTEHHIRVNGRLRCECGCMWEQAKPERDPAPPNPMRDKIALAIWSALEAQDDVYADPPMGTIDTSGSWTGLNMDAVADAVIAALGTRRCERCRKPAPLDHFPDPHPGSDEMRPFCIRCTRYVEWATS